MENYNLMKNITNEIDLKRLNNKSYSAIYISNSITLNLESDLTLKAREDIIFEENAFLTITGNKTLSLKAGIGDETGKGTVIFRNNDKPQIFIEGDGKVIIHYNPVPKLSEEIYIHKYHNPYVYSKHISPSTTLAEYMLVNSIEDLQNIMCFMSGNYALSQKIDASTTLNWNKGKGFNPLKLTNLKNPTPFSGNFDGNGFNITNLFINRPDENFVGLFGIIKGYTTYYTQIKNIGLIDANIVGQIYVGGLAGYTQSSIVANVLEDNVIITAKEIAGGITGSAKNVMIENVQCNALDIKVDEYGASIVGVIKNSITSELSNCCTQNSILGVADNTCFSYFANITLDGVYLQ